MKRVLRNDVDEFVPQTKLFDPNTGATKAIGDGWITYLPWKDGGSKAFKRADDCVCIFST